MSGAAWQIPLSGQVESPLPTIEGYAQAGQRTAQTGLIGQQIQAAKIQNMLAGLRVNAIAPLLGGGGAGPAGGGMPAGAPGMAAPGPASGAPPAAAGGGPSAPQQVSPYGAVMSPFGVAVPGLMAVQALTSADPTKAWESAITTRARTLAQMMAPVDPNNVQQWNRVAQTAYSAGWLSPDDYATIYNHPEHKQALLNSFADPNQHIETLRALAPQGMGLNANGEPGPAAGPMAAIGQKAALESGGKAAGELPYAGPLAAARTAGAGQYETIQVTVPDPDHPGQFRTDTVQKSALPAYLGANKDARPASAADLANPNVTLGPAAYAGRVQQRENGGGAAGATNPLSSAVGNGQFLERTWLDTVAAAKPAWAQGMSQQQILAQRASPARSAEMSYAYAQQNAPLLQDAGIPVNSLTLGLAQQFGPQGAVAVMHAAPDTPLSQIVSRDVMTANPQFGRMTAGQAMAAAFPAYGMNQVDLGQPTGAAAPPTTIAPGSAPGLPKLTPQGEAALKNTQDTINADRKDVTESLGAAQNGQKAQTQLLQVRDLAGQINTGSLANAAQSVQNYLATFAPDAANRFAAAITAGKIDPSKAGATQEFVKLTLQQAGMAERETLGARGGLGAIQLYQRAFPNIEMQPQAIKDMTNLLLIAHQRDVDYGQGVNSYFGNNNEAFNNGGQYNRVGNFDANFLQSNSPQVYVGAAAALNGKPFAEWAHGMTPGQQQEALRILWRADPGAVVTGADGKTQYRNPALAAQ